MPSARSEGDKLSPQTIHDLLTLLTVIRGEEHLVRRWVRLRDTSDGYERILERLDHTDALIQRLADELVVRADADDSAPPFKE